MTIRQRRVKERKKKEKRGVLSNTWEHESDNAALTLDGNSTVHLNERNYACEWL